MKKVKTYGQYLIVEENFKDLLMISLYESLTNEDKLELDKKLLNKYLINENIIKTLSEKGKSILLSLAKTASNIVNFLDNIKAELTKHIKEILTNSKEKIKQKLSANKVFVDSIKKEINVDKNAFLHDVKTCKEVSEFYVSKFQDCIINDVMKALKNLFVHKKHDLEVKKMIKEGLDISIIDNLVQHLHKIPPFAWLDMLHHKGTKGAEHLINGLSYITRHLGGPHFTLPVMSSILGIAFEYNIKGLVKHGLLDAADVFTIPFIGLVVKTAGNVATFLACYEVCRELVATSDSLNHKKH
jgi:hypothetical protein